MAFRGAVGCLAIAVAATVPAVAPGAEAKLAKGKFLVASRDLTDPNFARTVVLLLDYGPDGAVGLIINRRTEVRLGDALPEIEELQRHPGVVYAGGPVAPAGVMVLVRSPRPPEQSKPVLDEIHVSQSDALLRRLASEGKGERSFRIYAGYAGWVPGQLDHEVTLGGWTIIPADADTVFADEPSTIWRRLVPRDRSRWTMLAPAPEPATGSGSVRDGPAGD